jgi:putative oxidoreductase
VLGVATRLGALGLFIVNYVAVISFPDMGAVGLKDHVLWGVLLAMIFFHGPGRLSIDEWLRRRFTTPQ